METFRLGKPLNVVSLDEEGKGKLVTLPVGAAITVCGASTIPSCVEIVCGESRYNAFEQDLRDRAEKSSATSSS
ncbi:MAG TPA: hypothetical protein VK776_24100 [Bryobacteraceae bacterium]|jgi:hypothetical protein|nr:hypothetical protein [Bryobacteraceae bacterium]